MRKALLYLFIMLLAGAPLISTGCSRGDELYNFRAPSIYQVLGTVFDAKGDPVSDAPVILHNSPTTRVVITLTDASGKYTFDGLTEGDYQVAPQKEGYGFSPASKMITLTSATKSGTLNFTATR